MNTFLNISWPELVNVVVSFGVTGLVLVLIGTAHIWRDRVHHERKAIRGDAHDDLRSTRNVERVRRSQMHQEYLANAAFSYEGNPHFDWQQRFLERSIN